MNDKYEQLRKLHNTELTDTKCSFCEQRRLTKKVLDYSTKRFGQALCFQCQKFSRYEKLNN